MEKIFLIKIERTLFNEIFMIISPTRYKKNKLSFLRSVSPQHCYIGRKKMKINQCSLLYNGEKKQYILIFIDARNRFKQMFVIKSKSKLLQLAKIINEKIASIILGSKS